MNTSSVVSNAELLSVCSFRLLMLMLNRSWNMALVFLVGKYKRRHINDALNHLQP
jgi:hypothetical protein